MRATINSGLNVTLLKRDKEAGERIGRIECIIEQFIRPKLVLHIVENMARNIKDSDSLLEESGFHITAIPKYGGPETRMQYDVYLTKEIFTKLTNPKGDPVNEGGHFASRCLYDRVDINYWGM